MDYEQKYYDLLFENKKLKQQIESLKSEIEAYELVGKYNKNGLTKYVVNLMRRKNEK